MINRINFFIFKNSSQMSTKWYQKNWKNLLVNKKVDFKYECSSVSVIQMYLKGFLPNLTPKNLIIMYE